MCFGSRPPGTQRSPSDWMRQAEPQALNSHRSQMEKGVKQMLETTRRHEEAQAHIRTTIAEEFCRVVDMTGLPPLEILRLAAQAVGSIYGEAAEAHRGIDACPCGWRPQPAADIEMLAMALVTACRGSGQDLGSMRIAGSA